jgi:hypothetical protein
MYQDFIGTLKERREKLEAAIGALEALDPKVKAGRPRQQATTGIAASGPPLTPAQFYVRSSLLPKKRAKKVARAPRGAFQVAVSALLRSAGKRPLKISDITGRLVKRADFANRKRSSVETQVHNLIRRKPKIFKRTSEGVALEV